MSSQYRQRDYPPHSLVHFTLRGFKKRRIVHDRFDHADFLDTLRELLDARPTVCLPAWAQMANHQHVFLDVGPAPAVAGRLMGSLSRSYAQAYNFRYGAAGPVFQSPFRGKIVRGSDHLMNTFAYIHLNPDASVRMTNSSHAYYAGQADDPHIDPSIASRAFGGREGYLEFFNDTAKLRAARAAARQRLDG